MYKIHVHKNKMAELSCPICILLKSYNQQQYTTLYDRPISAVTDKKRCYINVQTAKDQTSIESTQPGQSLYCLHRKCMDSQTGLKTCCLQIHVGLEDEIL